MRYLSNIFLYLSLLIAIIGVFYGGVWLYIIWPASIILGTLFMAYKDRKTKKIYLWIGLVILTTIILLYGLNK